MWSGHKVLIKQDGQVCKVVIDGMEVKGLQYVTFESRIDEMPSIMLEFLVNEVEIENEGGQAE